MTVNAVIGLLDPPTKVASGEISLNGRCIDNLSPEEKREIKGGEIAMIFQGSLSSLSRLFTIGNN
ncbi:MAG: hypothetical protein ACPG5U_02525 [Planktomarina sp.]